MLLIKRKLKIIAIKAKINENKKRKYNTLTIVLAAINGKGSASS